jgi:uncharacterized protein (DUF4415 family)
MAFCKIEIRFYFAEMIERRVCRPRSGEAKQLIAIRLHPQVLARIQAMARQQEKPYQTLR